MPGAAAHQDMKSSLPLEICTYFHRFYAAALVVVALLLFIYKGVLLPYPPSALGLEVAFVFAYGLVEWARLRFSSRGNRAELIGPLLLSLCLAVGVVIFHVFYIRLQTYVLRLDIILHGIALAFVSVEVLLQGAALLTFWRAQRF